MHYEYVLTADDYNPETCETTTVEIFSTHEYEEINAEYMHVDAENPRIIKRRCECGG